MNHYLSKQDCKTITCVHFSANHPSPYLVFTVPKWPKMTENGPRNRVIPILPENGSKDFSNFWHEVRGWYLKKNDWDGLFPKIPVFRNSGPTTRFGTEKLKFSKHRHVTPRWMQNCTRITKKIFSGHFALFGPKNWPKRVKKLQNDWNFEILSFC